MDIINYTIYKDIDNTIFKMMKSYLTNNDIDKIYKEWNFWDGRVERFKNKNSRVSFLKFSLLETSLQQPHASSPMT